MSEQQYLVDYSGVSIISNETKLLNDINLVVSSGELVTIEGIVGAGKSTLLKSIYADRQIVDGKAEVLGFNLRKLPSRKISKLRRQMGIIFQNFLLFDNKTVLDNLKFVIDSVEFKVEGNVKDYIISVLENVGLKDKADVFPHNLSGGERQTVAIARAMVHKPKLILADEPTGNLDEESALHIAQLLFEATKSGAGVIVATHDEPIFANFEHKIYKIKDGILL
ncbi:MAG: ATP-binding cassette domain-containing protein [Bacteroidales bacterium]|nr:ATP-binding cassette domain-containing protein [Bacteroidales bacterium]